MRVLVCALAFAVACHAADFTPDEKAVIISTGAQMKVAELNYEKVAGPLTAALKAAKDLYDASTKDQAVAQNAAIAAGCARAGVPADKPADCDLDFAKWQATYRPAKPASPEEKKLIEPAAK